MRCFKSLVLVLALLFPLPGFGEGPKVVVEEPEYHFGQVLQGDKVDHAFILQNQGSEALVIQQVKSSCGCTAALASAREIAPGEQGEVRASFDSTRFQGMVVKTVYVYTNDPVHQVLQLHLRGQVREELKLDPPRVTFPTLQPEQEGRVQVTIANVGRETIVLSNLRTTAREVKAVLSKEVLAPGDKAEVELVAKLARGTPQVNGYLLAATSSTRLPELRIPFRVQLVP